VSRFQRLLALAAVGLLGAIGVTGVMAGPGVFSGSPDDSAAAALGDVQTPDSIVAESGDTPDGETQDVGDESADDSSGEQGDDDQGDDVNDADEQEVAGEVIDCPSGEDTHFKFEQSSDEFEVTGTLVSLGDGSVVVTGPDGDVTAAVDPNAEIEGDPQPGDPVKVEGAVLEDGSLVAWEVESACDDEDDSDDADENHDADDDDSGDDSISSGDGDHSGDDSSGGDSDDDSHHDSSHDSSPDSSGPSGDHSEED